MLVLLIVVGSSIWVFFDAKSIGIQKGQVKGIANMGTVGWLIACLLLWIVCFPVYLAKRKAFKTINNKTGSDTLPLTFGWLLYAFTVLVMIAPLFAAPAAR